MSTLKERLTSAMGDQSAATLARECGISRAAVSKWFGDGKSIKAEHIFTLARVCGVDAEWLATGKGKPDRGVAQTRADMKEIPAHRLELIRRYGNLPKDLRFPIRTLIDTLSAAVSENYAKWSAEMHKISEARDAAPRPKGKKLTTE